MKPLEVIHLGSCILNAPINALLDRRAIRWCLDRGGFQRAPEIAKWSPERGGRRFSPAVYCIDGAVQLVRFLSGEVDVPVELRALCDLEPDWRWNPVWRECLGMAEVALVEISFSSGIQMDSCFLSHMEVIEKIVQPLSAISDELKVAANAWFNQGLIGGNEEVRVGAGKRLAAAVTTDGRDADVSRAVLLQARSHQRDMSGFVAGIATIRDALDCPLGIVTHTRTYMPDGRPVPWPSNLVEQTVAAAEELGLPLFHPSEIVEQCGTVAALEDDLCHYRVAFWPVLGDALLEFITEVKKRGEASASQAMRPEADAK
jgi:hypothetical protein